MSSGPSDSSTRSSGFNGPAAGVGAVRRGEGPGPPRTAADVEGGGRRGGPLRRVPGSDPDRGGEESRGDVARAPAQGAGSAAREAGDRRGEARPVSLGYRAPDGGPGAAVGRRHHHLLPP